MPKRLADPLRDGEWLMTRHLEPKRGGKTSRVNTFAAAALAFAETKPLNIKKNWRSAPCRTPCRQTAV